MHKVVFSLAVLLMIATTANAQISFSATIDGLQPVPPTNSPATGSATMTLDESNMLSYEIAFSGLDATETIAHFHGPAPVGANAGVQFGLPLGSPKVGTAGPLSASQVDDLMAGLWYINIHSQAFPGGEIRGQVLMVVVPNEEHSVSSIKSSYDER
jgi:hypothetical protein